MLALSDVTDNYCVTLDAEKEKNLRVYFPRRIFKFK